MNRFQTQKFLPQKMRPIGKRNSAKVQMFNKNWFPENPLGFLDLLLKFSGIKLG